MKKALITGAAGFIGGAAVRCFLGHGWRVHAVTHRSRAEELERPAAAGEVTLLRADLREAVEAQRAVEASAPDAVIHCAGRASDTGWDREFRRTNYETVRHLVRCVRERPSTRLVFVSTTDVYGLCDFAGESEDELPLAEAARHPYPKYKIAAEKWIRANLPPEQFCLVRPAQVWGKGDRTITPRMVEFLRRSPWIVHFGPWRGSNRAPLAHVRNVAEALFLGATAPAAAGACFNVLDDERTSLEAFYRALAAVHFPRRSFRSVTLPRWCGRLLALPLTALSDFFNRAPPIADPTLYALRTVSSNLDFSNRRCRSLFAAAGYRPVTFAEGLRELSP